MDARPWGERAGAPDSLSPPLSRLAAPLDAESGEDLGRVDEGLGPRDVPPACQPHFGSSPPHGEAADGVSIRC